jgi:hypothetical protein
MRESKIMSNSINRPDSSIPRSASPHMSRRLKVPAKENVDVSTVTGPQVQRERLPVQVNVSVEMGTTPPDRNGNYTLI